MLKKKLFICFFSVIQINIITAQTGQLLFQDHFDDNYRNWQVGSFNWGQSEIKDGKLIISCAKDHRALVHVPGLELKGDFTVDVTTKWLGNETEDARTYSGYGLAKDPCSFFIYANGDRRLYAYSYGNRYGAFPVNWGGVQQSIKTLRLGENRMKLVYSNGVAELFVNGSSLYRRPISFRDNDLEFDVEGTEKIEFDDLIVRSGAKTNKEYVNTYNDEINNNFLLNNNQYAYIFKSTSLKYGVRVLEKNLSTDILLFPFFDKIVLNNEVLDCTIGSRVFSVNPKDLIGENRIKVAEKLPSVICSSCNGTGTILKTITKEGEMTETTTYKTTTSYETKWDTKTNTNKGYTKTTTTPVKSYEKRPSSTRTESKSCLFCNGTGYQEQVINRHIRWDNVTNTYIIEEN